MVRPSDDRADYQREKALLATGQFITPVALKGAKQQWLNPRLASYPDFVAGEAVRSQLSPDGNTLAILTAGQNSLYKTDGTVDTANSTQYIFLYDVSGANRQSPQLRQVITQRNSHVGMVFSPDGSKLYVAGGADDLVYVYTQAAGGWIAAAPIALGHADKGVGIRVRPNAAGLAISRDGTTLVVANNYNDSISVIDAKTGTVRYEHDLRPFFGGNEGQAGAAGGTFPFAVALSADGRTAYVSSDRDREVDVVDISSMTSGKLVTRIKLDGNALGMTIDSRRGKLYVAQDNADQVAVIDVATNKVIEKIDARAPKGVLPRTKYTGAATFAVTLAPGGNTLYAINSGANSIATIPLQGRDAFRVQGLIPTAYEPHDVTLSPDGRWMYIINGKSVTGPNPSHLAGSTANITSTTYPGGNAAAAAAARASNQYQFQLERASLVSAPVPTEDELEDLTAKVARNNHYAGAVEHEDDREVMRFMRDRIKHVIYIVKENRTFDQVLGDLDNGANADPTLTQFGRGLTPNNHKLATTFVTLDNFMNPGDGSMDGWSWSLQGRVTNTETITQQINYAAVNRGLSYESEGSNRNVPVNLDGVAARDAAAGPAGTTNYSAATAGVPGGTANVLAGTGNHASTDAPFGVQGGYVFNAVQKAGGTVRNYGFLVNNIGSIGTIAAPVSSPYAAGVPQVAALDASLAPVTDVYFRGYDQSYPDLWRYNEWKREFDQFVANGKLPSLSLVRFSHDHMGNFTAALAGVNTPETQQADCDLALGLLVQAVARSRYAKDTLILVIEDDVQDGPDHVDSHRGIAHVIGPYVKQGAVINTHYSQVNMLRTIEDLLGTEHINLNTAFQRPMSKVFDTEATGAWAYEAEASTVLKTTQLNLLDGGVPIKLAAGPQLKPQHDAAYWSQVTEGFNFAQADHVPPERFNRLLWAGLKGASPYPVVSGSDRASDDIDD
ncbi:MAG: beta-propeller fold lactonase family protein [Betaproteobacteria bacterium]|nr:beta-propeller fold lactonase family protein [Betaproteobacteria bacterium]